MSTIAKNLPSPPNGFSTTLSASVSNSDLTLPLNSVVGLGTEGVGVLFKKDSAGAVVASSVEYVHWTGVSGNNLTLSNTGDRGVTGSYNGAQAFSNGDYFEVWVSSHYYSGTANLVEHNADGTHNFHALTEKTTPVDADEVAIVDSEASNVLKRLTWANVKATLLSYFQGVFSVLANSWDGWVSITGTWTASDANSISVNADITSLIQKGDKIKLTNNSAVKYFYVTTTPVYSTGATTFDVTGEVDLVAGAITLPYFSKIESPQGFKRGEIWYKAMAHVNYNPEFSEITDTKIVFNTKDYDPNNNFDTSNFKYVCPISGYYAIKYVCNFSSATGKIIRASSLIRKNNSPLHTRAEILMTSQDGYLVSIPISYNEYLQKGDYLEGYVYVDTADGSSIIYYGGETIISIQFISI